MNPEMFNVFVSYSTSDLQNVEELKNSLVGSGINVFVAEHSVLASETLSDKISTAIAACDLVILLWSSNAKASEWVSQEIGKAHSLHKTILPLVLEDGLHLPGFISGLKYLPVFKDRQTAMSQAHAFVMEQLQAKQVVARRKEEEEKTRNFLVVGGLLFWLFSQK